MSDIEDIKRIVNGMQNHLVVPPETMAEMQDRIEQLEREKAELVADLKEIERRRYGDWTPILRASLSRIEGETK